MSKELRELLNSLDLKNKAMGELLNKEGVTKEELQTISNEIDTLEVKIQAQKQKDKIDNSFKDDAGTLITTPEEGIIYNGELFTRAIANSILEQRNMPGLKFTSEEKAKITEKIGEDGGYAVPEDIQVKINKRLKDETDLSTLADSEKVYTRKGSRNYEKRSDQTALINLDEYESIADADNPKLERLSFNLHDFAGMITIPNDLLQFATKELEAYIIDWLVDKVRFTRNIKILYGTGGSTDVQGVLTSTKYKKVSLPEKATIKDFKTLKNVTLMNVFKRTAKWIVNQDGFNFLDSLEDKQGRPFLQPNPKDATQYLFLGLEVIELPNTVMKTTETEVPIILGDMKEAYKYFYDDDYQLLTTNVGAGAFETNTTKTRLITKLDGTEKDKDAIVIGEIALPVEP